jgi:hypothetical protein
VTRQEAKTAGLVVLTTDERPDAKVQTVLGEVLWAEWCRREVLRLQAAGRQAEIVENTGSWAVWASPAPPNSATRTSSSPCC